MTPRKSVFDPRLCECEILMPGHSSVRGGDPRPPPPWRRSYYGALASFSPFSSFPDPSFSPSSFHVPGFFMRRPFFLLRPPEFAPFFTGVFSFFHPSGCLLFFVCSLLAQSPQSVQGLFELPLRRFPCFCPVALHFPPQFSFFRGLL